MDELDIKILRELLKNARLSYRAIADKVGVAIGTVISRIKKMEKGNVIMGYSAILNHEELGYELTVITEITVSKGKLVEVEKEVAKIPNVCCVYDITGLTDAIVIAKFKDRKSLSDFTKNLLSLPYVERTNTHVVLTTVKEDFRII
ncbi:AsnC family transcriptional regulator [Candidatus Bathyarchaeota archaeon B24-2]|nr:MAG: AsnC family transcriptional regulator [Candidatus Bathyarchaeota archaeon B24-2]